MGMKEFRSHAKEAVLENPVPITFMWDERELTIHPPNSGQIALFMASQTEDVELADQASAVLNFLQSGMDEEDRQWFRRHLQEGGTTIADITEVMEWLIEQWSLRPTTSSSGSSSRRRNTGKSSTAKQDSKA